MLHPLPYRSAASGLAMKRTNASIRSHVPASSGLGRVLINSPVPFTPRGGHRAKPMIVIYWIEQRRGSGAIGYTETTQMVSTWPPPLRASSVRSPDHFHELGNLAPLFGSVACDDRLLDAMADVIAQDFLFGAS